MERPGQLLAMLAAVRSVVFSRICAELRELARKLPLEQVLPGFRWLTPGSVLLGVGETFVYGAYAGFVFTLIHNAVLRRGQ